MESKVLTVSRVFLEYYHSLPFFIFRRLLIKWSVEKIKLPSLCSSDMNLFLTLQSILLQIKTGRLLSHIVLAHCTKTESCLCKMDKTFLNLLATPRSFTENYR